MTSKIYIPPNKKEPFQLTHDLPAKTLLHMPQESGAWAHNNTPVQYYLTKEEWCALEKRWSA
jgi:hypothetical protein